MDTLKANLKKAEKRAEMAMEENVNYEKAKERDEECAEEEKMKRLK